MKKILKSLAVLALVISAGCVNELANDIDVSAGKTVVTVGLEATKTYLGDVVDGTRKVYWSEDDQIAINGVASTSICIADGNTFAEFTFDGELNRPFSVLYPASGYVDAQTITLPAVQAAATGTFASGSAPMAGYAGEGDALHLHHLAAVVRLQVKLPAESEHAECTLYKVEIRGKLGEQMSGNFLIDYQAATLTPASDEEADKVVTTMVGKSLSSEVVDVFVVVPAQEYADGFSVRLIDNKGHYMDVNAKPCSLEKGEIKVMTPLEFAPTSTLVGVEIISTAAELVAFAKAYNEGDEYAEVENLQVILANDIEFDEATNTEWVPIGTKESYFKGTFDGGNFSVRNWVSSRPLFFGIDREGTVKNLTVDASCTLTANYAAEHNYFGAITGYNNGLLLECHNHADIDVTGSWEKVDDAYVAGLAGRVDTDARIEKCSMTGDLTADETFKVKRDVFFAGITGRSGTGSVTLNCDFTGNLTFAGNATRYAYVGGVVGQAYGGEVSECSTAQGKTISGGHESSTAKYIYWGGIVGSAISTSKVYKCENNASVELKYQRASSTNSVRFGGVVGYLAGTTIVEDCDNKGAVHSASAYQTICLGGVVGEAANETTIRNCHNVNGEIVAKSSEAGSYGAKNLYMGGVVGKCTTPNVTDISNSGRVEVKHFEDNADSKVNVGGCIGELGASLNGQNTTITNSGAVISTDAIANRSYLALGGVVGSLNKADAVLSYVSNTGTVEDAASVAHTNSFSGGVVGYVRLNSTVDHVTNGELNATDKGKVTFTNSEKQTHTNTCLGGVVGAIDADCVGTIQNSINYGEVYRVATHNKADQSGMICGGIVGILKGAGSSVKDCKNYGMIKNDCYNTLYNLNTTFDPTNSTYNGLASGGIVGFAFGSDTAYVTISSCINNADCYSAYGFAGGIAGYARYTKISECEHTTETVGEAAGYSRVGGIAGCIDNSSITSCHVRKNATIDAKNQGNAGGIAGAMTETASVESSTAYVTLKNSRCGAIVALSASGATVTNCGAKGKIIDSKGERDITIADSDFDGYKKATVRDSYLLQ